MKRLIHVILFSLPVILISGSTVEHRIYSTSMNKQVPLIAVIPDIYFSTEILLPVVLLLHGHGGNYKNWSEKVDLEQRVDRYNSLIICPDGSPNSWYLDSPLDQGSQYETFMIDELIPWLRKNYRISRLGISGLSMGGHGALFLAFRHQDTFDAVSSISGGVDLTYSTVKWEISQKIGSYEKFSERWRDNSIVNMVYLVEKADLPIFIDCGIDDFFIECNRELHSRLLKIGVEHKYNEKPGRHNWDYWTKNLDDHLEFLGIALTENE